MMFELVAPGVIVFPGVTTEVLFSIRTVVLSVLNAISFTLLTLCTLLRRAAFTPSEMAGIGVALNLFIRNNEDS